MQQAEEGSVAGPHCCNGAGHKLTFGLLPAQALVIDYVFGPSHGPAVRGLGAAQAEDGRGGDLRPGLGLGLRGGRGRLALP